MLSANDVDYLLQATNSSVKRFGGSGPTLSHLAYVLSDKWPSQFTQVFGDQGTVAIRRLLQQHTFVGDEADVRAVMTTGDENAVLSELHTRLSEVIEAAPTGAAEKPQESGSSSVAAAPEAGVDAEWPQRTRRFLAAIEPRSDLLEREEAITQVASIMARQRRRVPIIVGGRGSGRTTLLGGLVEKLHAQLDGDRCFVWRVAPETLGPEPEAPLSRIIEDCDAPTVLVIDDFDRLAALGTPRPNGDVLKLLTAATPHPNLRLVLVCEPRYHRRLGLLAEDLEQDLVVVRLESLSEDAVREVVGRAMPAIKSDRGVTIAPALLAAALLPAKSTDLTVHPGLALDRLDTAVSRASVLGDTQADVVHLVGTGTDASRPKRATELKEQLGRRVVGQDGAIGSVASRLALTMARLDLRPERPDGVFLFVGPTGVGKTELARAMSASLFGSEARLIRLDMSEYSHDWAVSRLVGPMPGFVGSTEPESWLTTKVAQMPDCVLLLDEIEKAHPVVWNTFLQVFDAGRLTDSRGSTVDFSNVVIVMTSNLGALAASGPGLGFGSEGSSVRRARERIVEAVKAAMAPELINRIDELVVFDALTAEAIENIAETELVRVCARLAETGWAVSYDRDVVRHLAETGYDPAYGARHLQRNIERLFLGLIASAETTTTAVHVSEGKLVLDALVQ